MISLVCVVLMWGCLSGCERCARHKTPYKRFTEKGNEPWKRLLLGEIETVLAQESQECGSELQRGIAVSKL